MELITKTECKCVVLARLDEDGALSCRVTGHTDYSPGCATSAELIPPLEMQEAVKAAMTNMLEWAATRMAAPISDAVHTSRTVAQAHQEI